MIEVFGRGGSGGLFDIYFIFFFKRVRGWFCNRVLLIGCFFFWEEGIVEVRSCSRVSLLMFYGS